jgi:large subunit ribosomal protein L25
MMVLSNVELTMTEIVKLTAESRERVGKGVARALRREGKIPAVLYGDKKDPLGLAIAQGQVTRLYNSGRALSTLLDIEVDGKTHRAIARDLQLHPVTDVILHADFLRLGKGATIAVEVSVHFINEEASPGIKRGGVLNVVRYNVELICPADAIPEAITIDLTGTELGDSIHISSVTLPDGVKPVIQDRDFTVATIAAPAGLKSEANAEGDDADGEEGEAESDSEE